MFLPPSFPWAWLLLGLAAWIPEPPADSAPPPQDPFTDARHRMVAEQIVSRGIRDQAVLRAMREVPRHLFVPAGQTEDAYADGPLPIGNGQTISQPYIVALMTELARPHPTDRALEIGTGCGYQSAVLARVVAHVYTVEIVDALAADAAARLKRLGYSNITSRSGDGYEGWPGEAPFDIILVTAAPPQVPDALVQQLKPGGRMVVPVGDTLAQNLELVEKDHAGGLHRRVVAPVRFVPMIKK
jgi:protein-L-isoaspartate(D-aspartate) O-methyltransferase